LWCFFLHVLPFLQCFLPVQTWHVTPPRPQAASLGVVMQVVPWQQPVQLAGVQVGGGLTQAEPLQTCPVAQATHAAPPEPQAPCALPFAQAPPVVQQPAQFAGPQGVTTLLHWPPPPGSALHCAWNRPPFVQSVQVAPAEPQAPTFVPGLQVSAPLAAAVQHPVGQIEAHVVPEQVPLAELLLQVWPPWQRGPQTVLGAFGPIAAAFTPQVFGWPKATHCCPVAVVVWQVPAAQFSCVTHVPPVPVAFGEQT